MFFSSMTEVMCNNTDELIAMRGGLRGQSSIIGGILVGEIGRPRAQGKIQFHRCISEPHVENIEPNELVNGEESCIEIRFLKLWLAKARCIRKQNLHPKTISPRPHIRHGVHRELPSRDHQVVHGNGHCIH